MRILIVDSDLISLQALSDIVSQSYSVETCDNDEDAFENVLTDHFDLVVISTDLRTETGLALVRKIRERSINIPLFVIAVSDIHEKSEPELKRHNCTVFLKPLSVTDFMTAVQKVHKSLNPLRHDHET